MPPRSWALLLSQPLSCAPGKRSQRIPGPTSSAVFEEERQECGHAGPPGSHGAFMERCLPAGPRLREREAGHCAWGGFVRGGMHRWISSVHLSLCDGDSVQKRTRVAGHSGPPGGPDHPPRPLTQKRKMVHPPTFPVSLLLLKWMLSFSPSP